MSTRCQIGFVRDEKQEPADFEVLLYRHSDGYPGTCDGKEYGVLSDIYPFLSWFKEARGLSDTEYVSARLLQYLCNKYDKSVEKYEKKYANSMEKNEKDKKALTGILGHGICKMFHWDIEYYYLISPKNIRVYDVDVDYKDMDNPKFSFKLLETIEI